MDLTFSYSRRGPPSDEVSALSQPEDNATRAGLYEDAPMPLLAIRTMVLTCILSIALWVGLLILVLSLI